MPKPSKAARHKQTPLEIHDGWVLHLRAEKKAMI